MTKKAKTYGSSFYDLAMDEGLQQIFSQDLQLIKTLFDQVPEYRKFLSTPAISKDERVAALKEAWEGKIHQYSLNFLCVLCENDLIGEFSDCAAAFHERYNEEFGIVSAVVYTTSPLEAEAKEKLQRAIEKKTGKQVELTEKIDKDLIGGMRLEMNGIAYDSSVRYHMDALKQLLKDNTQNNY